MIPNRKILGLAAFLATASLPVQARTQFLPIPDEYRPRSCMVELARSRTLAGQATRPSYSYRTENFRILPVFGAGAADVSAALRITCMSLSMICPGTGPMPAIPAPSSWRGFRPASTRC